MTTVFETDPTIDVGYAKAQGSETKPTESGQSRPKQPERGTMRHKGWPIVGTPGAP
jgi:hypothetical protein